MPNNIYVKSWLSRYFETGSENIEMLFENTLALEFLIIWSIFETKCFNGFCTTGGIKSFVEKNNLDCSELQKGISHFHERYQEPIRWKNLIHQDRNAQKINPIKEKMLNLLNDQEKLEFLIYVICRYRNNMFHGNKGVMSWVRYEIEIRFCINSMMEIIDQMRKSSNQGPPKVN